MAFSRFFLVLAIAAIPLWYVYRTAENKQLLRLDRNLFLTDGQRRENEAQAAMVRAEEKAEAERKRAEATKEEEAIAATQRESAAKIEACLSLAKEAEASFARYIEERARYRSYTETFLRLPTPTGRLSNWDFEWVFRRLYLPLWPETEVNNHHARVLKVASSCRELLAAKEFVWGLPVEIEALEAERKHFDYGYRSLNESRSKIGLLLKYHREEFPNTLEGRLLEDRAFDVISDLRPRLDP